MIIILVWKKNVKEIFSNGHRSDQGEKFNVDYTSSTRFFYSSVVIWFMSHDVWLSANPGSPMVVCSWPIPVGTTIPLQFQSHYCTIYISHVSPSSVLGKTLIKDDPLPFDFSLLQTFPQNSARQNRPAGFVMLCFGGLFFVSGGGLEVSVRIS